MNILIPIIGFISAAILIFCAVVSFDMLRISRTRVGWILIAIAFMFMAFSQMMEMLFHLEAGSMGIYGRISPWSNLAVSILLAVGILRIRRILSNLKKSESEKRASENRFRTLFNNSSDEIFLADFEGNIIEVNHTAVQRLGYSRNELMKKNFADLKTSKYVPLVKINLEKIIQEKTHVYDSEHIAKDGTIIALEMSSRVIDYFGRPAILTIARDITERRMMERKIVGAILETEERERKRFATDLHDGLAPILSTIKLYADLIKKGNYNKINQEEAVQSLEELTDLAIKSSKEISNNIMPSILQDFGLAVAVRDFCQYINNTQSLNIITDTEHYQDMRPGIEETILFQAVKELINNTLKHSGATEAEVFLESHDGQINLFYKDNGAGFDPEKKLQERSGMGLNSILSKVETIKGKCMIKSAAGEGMTVLITLDRR